MKACTDLLFGDYTAVQDAPTRFDSAIFVPKSDTNPQDHCLVKGYVSYQVRFEVKLPISGWTQRFLMLGCGGILRLRLHRNVSGIDGGM